MRRSFVFKARLSPSTVRRAERQMNVCRELYNAALEHRRNAWKKAHVRVTLFDQILELTEVRRVRPDVAAVDRSVSENVLQRVQWAFDGFFRRAKAGQAPGYPRFKSRDRYDSMTYRNTGWKMEGSRLTLRGIGAVRLFLSRPVEGTIKTVTLKRDACGDWFATLSCDGVPTRPLVETGRSVGVDLGLEHFLTTSDGEHVENPRPFVATQARLARETRRRSKMKRGGSRSARQRVRIAKLHRRVERTRRDFHFKTALDLVRRYDLIVAEDLNVRGLSRGILAKHVQDAGWGRFIETLSAKAEEAGRSLVAVDPSGTSQVCSGCGCEPERKRTLSERTHECADCGLILDRDINAARNILTRAGALPAASRPAGKAAALTRKPTQAERWKPTRCSWGQNPPIGQTNP